MAALLSSPVSTGFVARAHERFAERLEAAGFDDAMRSALVGEPVLCGDETPVNVAHKDSDEHGTTVPGAPHVLTVRTRRRTPGVVPGAAGPHEGRAAQSRGPRRLRRLSRT
jgi:transposase